MKTRSSKSRKIAIFPNGFTHGFGAKLAIFPTSFFQPIQSRKMCFTIFQNETRPFFSLKTRGSKSRKIGLFVKGLTNGFGPKMVIFPTSFFGAKQARKMSFTIFYKEKTPFQPLKSRRSKSRKIDIFPKGLTQGFGSKRDNFSSSVLQVIQARKMSFTRFQNEKTPFQAIKTRSLKSQKIALF